MPEDQQKPLGYDENVPDLLKKELELTCEQQAKVVELDKKSPWDRAKSGRDDWNLWAQAYRLRWLEKEDREWEVFWRLKASHEQEVIDFSEGQKPDENGNYEIAGHDFSGFLFPCKVEFSRATFRDEAAFDGAVFSDEAWFDGVIFRNGAWFSDATFMNGAWFSDATFHGPAGFSCAIFSGTAWFCRATFSSRVWFNDVSFKGRAWFNEVTFGGEAGFSSATFSDKTWFSDTTFVGTAWFSGVTFSSVLLSQQTVYLSVVCWDSCKFGSSTNYTGSRFLGGTDFSNCKMDGQVDFDHVWFGKTTKTPEPSQYDEWDEGLQKQYANWELAHESMNVPDFKGTMFSIAPNLGYTYVPEPLLPVWEKPVDRIKRFFGRIEDKIDDQEAASKYRRLQELAAQGHHHLAQKEFFRSELLCRRWHETSSWIEVLMINMFEIICRCGLSFWLPMRWLGWWTVAFAVIYASVSRFSLPHLLSPSTSWGTRWEDITALLSYSVSHSLPFMGLFTGKSDEAMKHLFFEATQEPYWLTFIQSGAAWVFIFFALLAVRNYFKLG